jgi:hypothetical protein
VRLTKVVGASIIADEMYKQTGKRANEEQTSRKGETRSKNGDGKHFQCKLRTQKQLVDR